MFRLLKVFLVLFIGLQALLYALQNVANLEEALGAISYVLSNQQHTIYPNTMFFSVTAPALHWAVLATVLAGETSVGIFGIKGAWDMFRARSGSAEDFHAAKKAGAWAAGLALFVWFGLFMTVGAAFFQMWQTQAGAGSMEGAFMYAMISAVTMLFVYLTPDD